MTAAGWVHLLGVWFAVVFGLAVLIGRKGDSAHRWMGRFYVAAMLVVNFAGLLVIGADGPGVFHVLALLSLATLATGLIVIRRQRSRAWPIAAHGHFMAWSFVGLLAAGIGQGAGFLNLPVSPAIIATLVAGGLWVHSSGIARTARRLASIDG